MALHLLFTVIPNASGSLAGIIKTKGEGVDHVVSVVGWGTDSKAAREHLLHAVQPWKYVAVNHVAPEDGMYWIVRTLSCGLAALVCGALMFEMNRSAPHCFDVIGI